jgi:NADPH:quinone reductase-like Zn-dependent oxidoreductase
MHAIQIKNFGPPLEVLELIELPEPSTPAAEEVLVGVEFAPINMNDLYLIEGVFPIRPNVPSVVGNEGVGRVLALGRDVRDLRVGDRVLIPLYAFSWRERMVLPAKGLFPLPADADPRQASMLGINPPTAAFLLREYVDLQPGDWVAQNAANSGVGRSVIAIAKARGLRTINFVRRPELIAELKAAGGDVVLVDEAGVLDKVRQAVGDGRVPLGIDGVAGGAAATVAGALTQGGTIVTYARPAGHDQSNGPDRKASGREGLFPELPGVRAEDPRGGA